MNTDNSSPIWGGRLERVRSFISDKRKDMRERRRDYLIRVALIFATALIDSAFFLGMVLPDLTPLPPVGSGIVFMVPVLSGLMLGLLLTEESYKMRAISGLYVIIVSGLIIFITLYWPVISGVAEDIGFYALWSLKWLMIAAIIITPTTLMGVLIGGSTAEY